MHDIAETSENNRHKIIKVRIPDVEAQYYVGDADNGLWVPAGYAHAVVEAAELTATDGDVTVTVHNVTQGTSAEATLTGVGTVDLGSRVNFSEGDELAVEVTNYTGTAGTGTVDAYILFTAEKTPR